MSKLFATGSVAKDARSKNASRISFATLFKQKRKRGRTAFAFETRRVDETETDQQGISPNQVFPHWYFSTCVLKLCRRI